MHWQARRLSELRQGQHLLAFLLVGKILANQQQPRTDPHHTVGHHSVLEFHHH